MAVYTHHNGSSANGMENCTLEGIEGCTTPVVTAEEVEAVTDIGSTTVEVEGAEVVVVVVWTTGALLPASEVNNWEELSAARTEDPRSEGSRAAETVHNATRTWTHL